MTYRLIHGDCLEVLPTLPAASFDAVVTDPPYPCIRRSYGYWTEAEWFALMDRVVPECRRVLKPTGSAVFILQPNSERVGRMRTWLWDFLAKWGREWGVVQDAYWWNHATLPVGGAITANLMRGSIKACVWLGREDCYRSQSAVLWHESARNIECRLSGTSGKEVHPSGRKINRRNILSAAARRGGVTPFNVLPIANVDSHSSAGAYGHGAGTPMKLCRWWVRYLCPPGGKVLDPFTGSGTVPLAALLEGRDAVGIERDAGYVQTARRRIRAARKEAIPA